ncbi:MAG: sulfatase-like hydrolase/transferase [Opitutae bacterium]
MKTLKKVCGLSLLLIATALQAATTPAKPNIVFILADDLGFAELSCNGGEAYKTPNIDALAKGGIRFNHFYTVPLCGPSRALILTGRYGFRTRAVDQDGSGTMTREGEGAEIMTPTILKKAGYTSAMIGKWGQILPCGDAKQWGFDYVLSFKASGIYWNVEKCAELIKTSKLEGEKGAEGGVRAKPGPYNINEKDLKLANDEYMPDIMEKNAFEFINKNKDKPFFLYYSLSHVHAQILPTPDSKPLPEDADAAKRMALTYNDNMVYMDKLVGNLVAELNRLKLRENTIIVFMGDNGTAKAQSDRATINGKRLIGSKGTMFEGGALVPFIVNWTGVTPADKLNTNVADSSDILPTLCELTGAPLPDKRVLDGKSLVSQIKGDTAPHRASIFIELGNAWYAREAGWKLNEKGELFDMKDAPFNEILVPADSKDPVAIAARERLSKVLSELNPAGGFTSEGSGRGGNKEAKKAKKADKAPKVK